MTKKRSPKPYTEQDIARIVEMRASGKTEREIAADLGRPYNSVHCKIKELRKRGLVTAVRYPTDLTDEQVATLQRRWGVDDTFVRLVQTAMDKSLRGDVEAVSLAIDKWGEQDGRCAYYGVRITLDGDKKASTRAVYVSGDEGEYIWVSLQGKKQRGKLSHRMFLRCIDTIYKHVFTSSSS